ncbi:MAG: PorT family protein [Dysgonamonadaceae bacterium]|jgi:hypothetical protein|nr:PorT family protein [Dysgonamonadaceae bacterium]
MKKTVLVICIALASVAIVNAQGLKWGVRAGFNTSTISNFPEFEISSEGGNLSTSSPYKPGFQLGVVAQYMLTSQFGLESGLYYSQIGSRHEVKTSLADLYATVITKTNPSYLQLPITVLYKFNVGTDLYLYPQAGLYLGYGLAGKVKFSYETNIPDVGSEDVLGDDSLDLDFFGKDSETNRFDAGLTLGLNLQYSNYVIGVGYDLGLLKINKESETGVKDMKNANVKVTLGYFF